MAVKFNPFTGQLQIDEKGSGGGSSYIDGEVATYNDLPLDGTAAINTAWLVREASGTWLIGRKPAGLYIRTATAGVSRDADYTYAGIFPDVFSDANFTLYDNGDSTKTAQFQLSGIATGQNRVVSLPDKNITLDDSGDPRDPNAHAASHAAGQADELFDQSLNQADDVTFASVSLNAAGIKFEGNAKINLEENSLYGTWGSTEGFYVGAGSYGGSLTVGKNATTVAVFSAANLTDSSTRNIDIPDASGTLALTSDIPANTIASTLIDAKGDLIVGTAADTVARLPVGATNGHVLTVDSAEASGMKWAAASGGISAVGASAADILSVSGSDLVADDPNADRLVFWDDSASKLAYLEVSTGLSLSGTTLTATASGGSKTYAVFSAEHNQPPASNYATLDTRNSIAVLDFDDATDESAVFVGIIPEGASLGSGLKIRLHWMATSATSGDCIWDVSLERMTTDLDSDSFDTIASGTAAANGTSGILTVTEITLTTIDSVTAGDGYRLKVTRDANNASDTMTGDAELVVVEVRSAA